MLTYHASSMDHWYLQQWLQVQIFWRQMKAIVQEKSLLLLLLHLPVSEQKDNQHSSFLIQ